ncbi:cytochrome d ubiquinol oxidase subunit II [Pseudonocardia sp. KRD-184]|uniref:Cytochrome d ubiquinol oxidase subunit II n=1 Tax=Pseudonocardia oceani TaxID=2792013 RepID=A0ABS6UI24_9PSEU|nr:cytochrome d ubiquinol oxidase subunit II [Pseudonocardia oceani]MBW0091792.1 cytochrome d ubiquinol oxidase subunit II [Pseudonocardia oceani]MBW0099278.1 cytochrome d ubiquinol oxidase subunit II [Pseudonocardia oceani]MBW0111750.1 cytochrome d ubiquinol oxidase subunit II [Pseudonocardia oceani]MBW0123943.1 cytochrome d ubiquinol oxidase subunit II [Pseudonocardia oceani]MBW0131896.1 cytochrome d ubiquinol oxidase subunit II [Pseudonocardia oceani]
MDLPTLWFLAIALLWTGYLVLEGFDFGVGMLLPAVGRDEAGRRTMINAIGPVWDGNEVWLITAIGAMFAAFPAWYAATLSGFYLPVLLIVVALVFRGVAFEYRGKIDSVVWRKRWDAAILGGSLVPAFGWGLVFANLLRGVEIGADGVVRSGLLDLLSPYALLGGLATTTLFVLHGALFLGLKTDGPVRHRARLTARTSAFAAVPVVGGFLAWTVRDQGSGAVAALLAVGLLLAAVAAAARWREGWAFAATAASIVALAVVVFDGLHPALMRSTVSPAFDLTVANASSGPYTLGVLSVIGAVFLPLVVGYQAWSYWVFRKRVRVEAS